MRDFNMFDFTQIELALSAPSLFLRLLKPFIWLAKTSWLAGWLADWLVGPLGCYCTMPMAWIMHIDLWSPLTDSPKHSAQLNSTELNWAELNSSQVKSSRVKSTVPVAKCRRRLHRRRCCRRFKPTFIFFSRSVDHKQETEM